MICPWVLVHVNWRSSSLQCPGNPSLLENIKVDNSLETHVVMKYKGIWVYFTLNREPLNNMEELLGSAYSLLPPNMRKKEVRNMRD